MCKPTFVLHPGKKHAEQALREAILEKLQTSFAQQQRILL